MIFTLVLAIALSLSGASTETAPGDIGTPGVTAPGETLTPPGETHTPPGETQTPP